MSKSESTIWPGQCCPIPLSNYPKIVMAHGSGGRLTHDLIKKMFQPILNNKYLEQGHDGAIIDDPHSRIVMTTDSHVVQPLFFPGGDIGKLSVIGTANDLAMCGATPQWLSLSLILEEGLDMEVLWRVIQSIGAASRECGVQIVTGDTKVIDRKGDGELLINTAGIGSLGHDLTIRPSQIQSGDQIILSGDIGRHGIAVLSARESLTFETEIESDCAPLHPMVKSLLDAKIPVHCLRDCTRGGLATALIELARDCGFSMSLSEDRIPVLDAVRGACELLGFDPLYVANEGRFVAFVPASHADHSLELLKQNPDGRSACLIGEVLKDTAGDVFGKNDFGGQRILDLLTGDQLPRIC